MNIDINYFQKYLVTRGILYMRKNIFLILIFSLFLFSGSTPSHVNAIIDSLTWDCQSSICFIADGKTIRIDPYRVLSAKTADIVLISHPHFDHFSSNDLRKVLKRSSTLIVPKRTLSKIKNYRVKEKIGVTPGDILHFGNTVIKVVPAYNSHDHLKENGWVGYIIITDGATLYYTGDTGRIPEMKNIDCDIVFMPLGQLFTMDSIQEAADAALDVHAKILIPIHFGLFEGKQSDVNKIRELLQGKVDVIEKKSLSLTNL